MSQIDKSMFPPGSLGRALCEQREAEAARNPNLHPIFQQILEPMKATPPIRREVFWIHVRDHMPDDEMAVLVWAKGDMFMAFMDGGEWRDAGNVKQLYGVTHWAQLPEGPT